MKKPDKDSQTFADKLEDRLVDFAVHSACVAFAKDSDR